MFRLDERWRSGATGRQAARRHQASVNSLAPPRSPRPQSALTVGELNGDGRAVGSDVASASPTSTSTAARCGWLSRPRVPLGTFNYARHFFVELLLCIREPCRRMRIRPSVTCDGDRQMLRPCDADASAHRCRNSSSRQWSPRPGPRPRVLGHLQNFGTSG